MVGFKFYAVCHAKDDSVNRGIERLGSDKYRGEYKKSLNLLTSYSQIYKKPKGSLSIPKNCNKLIIDSGAYDFIIKRKAEYPYEPKEYFINMLNLFNKRKIPLDYLVTMDLICNPVNSKTDHNNNLKKIRKTIENTKKLDKLFEQEDPKFKLMPVIQGYSVGEYEVCVQNLIESNVLVSKKSSDFLVGIGSLANRKKVSEIKAVVRAVGKKFSDNDYKNIKIHLFGTRLNAIKDHEIAQNISSFDSFSWTFPYRFGRVKLFTGSRMIEANTQKKLKEPEFYDISLRTTLAYVDFLNFKFIEEITKKLEKKIEMKIPSIREKVTPNIINNKKKYNPELYKKPNNNCKLLVFSGDKFVLLEPKNVKLSFQERYYIARKSMYQFFDIIESQKQNISNRISNLNLLKSDEIFKTDFIIIDTLFETIFQYLKKYKENFDNFEEVIETIQTIQKNYSEIIPFLGNGSYYNNQAIIDDFLPSSNKNTIEIDDYINSLVLEVQALKIVMKA